MPDPTRSHSLEAWADARPLDRKIVGVRMAGRWVVALVDETGEPKVGSGRSLHDAIEAAEDELELCGDVPELCSCGRDWPWKEGTFVGVQDDGVDQLELRNCVGCGSTRARVLPPGTRIVWGIRGARGVAKSLSGEQP